VALRADAASSTSSSVAFGDTVGTATGQITFAGASRTAPRQATSGASMYIVMGSASMAARSKSPSQEEETRRMWLVWAAAMLRSAFLVRGP